MLCFGIKYESQVVFEAHKGQRVQESQKRKADFFDSSYEPKNQDSSREKNIVIIYII